MQNEKLLESCILSNFPNYNSTITRMAAILSDMVDNSNIMRYQGIDRGKPVGGGSETIDGPEGATSRHLVGGSRSYAVPGWRGEGPGKPRPGQKRHAAFRLGLFGLSQIAASAGQGWRAVRAR
jgi:hypothetical protein